MPRWALPILFPWLASATLVLLGTPASGHPESAAPSLDPRVVAAWHEPAEVEAGEQWHGFLQLRPDAQVANVSYQVCNVADGVCFSFPHPAVDMGNGTFRFDTRDYLTNMGETVRWEAGWRVGVRWFLAEGAAHGNGTWVPPQDGDSIESHYLTFAIAGSPSQGAPSLPALVCLAALFGLAVQRRGRPL